MSEQKKTEEKKVLDAASAKSLAPTQPVATAMVPAVQYDEDCGQGFENQTSADKTIPFLNLLQDMSPEVKEKNEKYVKGAKPGMFYISALDQLFNGDDGCVIFACYTEHTMVEWIPRNDGGGFVGKHAIDSPIVQTARANAKDRRLKIGKNELVETFYIYAMVHRKKILPPGTVAKTILDLVDLNEPGIPALIPFTSTKITPYKRIMTQLGMFRIPGVPAPRNAPPLWVFPILLTSVYEQREAGDSYNIKAQFALGDKIESGLLMPKFDASGQIFSAYQMCKEFKAAVSGGLVKVDYSASGGGGSGGSESGGGAGGEQDIPF